MLGRGRYDFPFADFQLLKILVLQHCAQDLPSGPTVPTAAEEKQLAELVAAAAPSNLRVLIIGKQWFWLEWVSLNASDFPKLWAFEDARGNPVQRGAMNRVLSNRDWAFLNDIVACIPVHAHDEPSRHSVFDRNYMTLYRQSSSNHTPSVSRSGRRQEWELADCPILKEWRWAGDERAFYHGCGVNLP